MSCVPLAPSTQRSITTIKQEDEMNNQTTEQLKFIDAKRQLGLPLTKREVALWTLYGEAYKKSKEAAGNV